MKYAGMFTFVLAVGLFLTLISATVPWGPREVEPVVTTSPARGGAYLIFAGTSGGEVTKKQLEGQRELRVDGCARGSRIFTFTLEVTRSGKMTSYTAHSNTLTDEMRAGLQALRAGDTFAFRKTKAYLPNGKDVVDVHSREFVVA